MAVLHEYEWLVVVGALAAFAFGYATGSNDVANAFGTSVGSRTLSLRSAVIIAAIFEFAGCLLLGRVSTNTIASGIANVESFTRAPEVFAYGMVCALAVGAVFQLLASYCEANVSATHAIIGGIVGFSMVYKGKDAVQWAKKDPSSFPPIKGVVSIVLTWIIAPVLTAAAAAIFFLVLRTVVLRAKNAYTRSFWVWPLAVLVTVWINAFFIFTKGIKKTLSNDKSWTDDKAAWVSVCIAVGCALLSAAAIKPLRTSIDKRMQEEAAAAEHHHAVEMHTVEDDGDKPGPSGVGATAAAEPAEKPTRWGKMKMAARHWLGRAKKAALHGVNVDIHQAVEDDPVVAAIHARAEVFDPRVEAAFKYLQVFSAICVIFAHGAGEVGYMAGPLTSIYEIYKTGALVKNVKPTIWVLLISAFGLVFGLATYGYNVTRAMGVKLAKLSATRGFCAELATAFVIMIASQYGLPTSSSQCITGAIIGVGVCEGWRGVQWKVFGRQFFSWVCTLVVVGGVTAALFAQGIYSPSATCSDQIIVYEDRITAMTSNLYTEFNRTLQQYQPAASEGVLEPRLSNATWAELNRTVAYENTRAKNLTDTTTQSTHPEAVLDAFLKSLALYQNNTVLTLGQLRVYPGGAACNGANATSIRNEDAVACPAPKLVPSSARRRQ